MDPRRVELSLVQDGEHYDRLIEALRQSAVSAWIATATVKELHLRAPIGTRARAQGRYQSILEVFATLVGRGVDLRLLHGATPSGPFRQALPRYRALQAGGFAMRQCPRVHLKMVAIDGSLLYLGSANLTGAGLGAKADRRRNFEVGILTEDDLLLDQMQELFETIWSGRRCGGCGLRRRCPAPLDQLCQAEAGR